MLDHVSYRQKRTNKRPALRLGAAPSVLGLIAIFLAGCSWFSPTPAPTPPPPTYEVKSYGKIELGCGDHGHRDEPCVSFRLSWPELKGGPDSAASKINTALLAALGFPGGPAEMEPFADALVERWRVERKGVFYADSTWFERRTIQVLARRPGVWSFRFDRLGHTGKEIPFDERQYLNLSPVNGSSVSLDSLLEKDAAPRLSALAEQRLRDKLDPAAGSTLPLKEARFFMPRQYALTQTGLGLLWSGDELADPAAPRIEITLPWSQIRDLVRKAAVNPPGPETGSGF